MSLKRPTSDADICNLAMGLLRCSDIVSDIDSPSSDTEGLCSRWYVLTRQSLLREFIWNFAKTRGTLSRVETPSFGFTDAYQMPVSLLRVNIIATSSGTRIEEYTIEGRKILVDADGASTIRIVYQQDIESVSQMDPLFVDMFSQKLAWRIAYQITQKLSITDKMRDTYMMTAQSAIAVDGQESPPILIRRNKIAERRRTLSPYGELSNKQIDLS